MRMQAAAAVAAKVVASVGKMGKVLGKSMTLGAPPLKISLGSMTMDVRKSTPSSLVENKIQSAIGGCKIDGGLDVEGDDCVAIQVL